MALAKMGGGIVEITGKFAGNVFKRDASGQHTQALPRTLKRNPSSSQRTQRNAWRRCNVYWLKNMTEANRTLWMMYAASHPTTNKQGSQITLTAYQSFLSINLVRAANNLTITATPPT